jgi:hypothetical protein
MIKAITPEYVERMPEKADMKPGVLYISENFGLAIHLCACDSCGFETVTPLDDGKVGWQMTKDDGRITLSPSIGCFQHPCKSHYWIRQNEVVWC